METAGKTRREREKKKIETLDYMANGNVWRKRLEGYTGYQDDSSESHPAIEGSH